MPLSTESTIPVAVYGTLRQGRRWHSLLAASPFLGAGLTKQKYALYLAEYPCVNKDLAISQIRVEVYLVNEQILENLDELEEHPLVYLREWIPILLDKGDQIDAWFYFLPQASGRLVPHGDYAQEYHAPSSLDLNDGIKTR